MNNQKLAILPESEDVEIGLLDLVGALWQQRWIIFGVVAASVALAIFYLNVATYKYTAELKVTPSQSSGAGSSSVGGLASLASIAGVNISQDGAVTPFELYLEGLKSGLVAGSLVDRNDIMKVIYQAEWNESAQEFQERTSLSGNISRTVKRGLGLPVYSWNEPSAARLQAYIQENIKITESPKSSVVTISFSHPDPKFAKYFLTIIHDSLDDHLRQKAITRSNKYISYLTAKLQQVSIAEHRAALAEALSEQEKFRMKASSGLAYAADPFGGVATSLQPTTPRPSIIIVLSIILGTVLGSLAGLAKWWLGSQRQHTDVAPEQ